MSDPYYSDETAKGRERVMSDAGGVRKGDVLLCYVETNCGKVTALTSSDGASWGMITAKPPKWWQFLRSLLGTRRTA